MVLTVIPLDVRGPVVDIPPFFKPNCRYLFDIEKEKKGNSIFLTLSPTLDCHHIAERRWHPVAWVNFDMDIQTNGTISVEEFHGVFGRATELFKNMLASHPAGPRIGLKNISCPPLIVMQDQLKALVDWFQNPPK